MSIRLPRTNNGSMFHHCKRLLTVDLQLFTSCMLKSCQSVLPSMSEHGPKALLFSKCSSSTRIRMNKLFEEGLSQNISPHLAPILATKTLRHLWIIRNHTCLCLKKPVNVSQNIWSHSSRQLMAGLRGFQSGSTDVMLWLTQRSGGIQCPKCKGSKFKPGGEKKTYVSWFCISGCFWMFFVFSAWERKNDHSDLAR